MSVDYEEFNSALTNEGLTEKDQLTGVLNRESFVNRLEKVINSSKADMRHAIMKIDFDGMKQLNNKYGRADVDQVLFEMSNLISSSLRQEDLLGRINPEGFVVCICDIPYDAILEKKAGYLGTLLRKQIDDKITISANIGIAVFPRDGTDFDTLSRRADIALLDVKNMENEGKKTFQFYKNDFEESEITTSSTKNPLFDNEPLNSAKQRILIVDDNKMNRVLLVKMFEEDYIVETARDGREALIRMRHFGSSLSVVLLDLIMPGLDGFEVLESMQNSPIMKSIPVIIVSGESERETSLKAIKCGASDYVTKPVDPDLIRMRVKSAISKAENERLRAQNSYLILQSGEEARYRTVLESTGTVVIELDWPSGVFTYDTLISKHIGGKFDNRKLWHILLSDRIADSMDVREMQNLVHNIAGDKTRESATLNVKLKTPQNEKHWFRMSVFKRSSEFKLTLKIIMTFNDINEEVISEEKLRFQAQRDDLTGLYNRREFFRRVEHMVSSRSSNSYILSVGDIDGFKIVNDRFGHAEGDKLLRYVAERINSDIKDVGGLCGRMGNDVFATLLPSSNSVVQRMAQYPFRVLSDFTIDLKLTCTIGNYLIEDPKMTADEMFDRATLAKQSVKGSYDKKSAWYDETMRKKMLIEQEIVGSMEEALAKKQFDVYIQPQYNHSNGQICGGEALVRWIHPEKGMISPGEFIPILEKTGFITKLDEYVWDRTAELLRRWIDKGYDPVPISVNVSRLDTSDPLLCDKLVNIVEKHQIPVNIFRIEITESLFVEDVDSLIVVVDKLHKSGFLIEMDDFGSGYSSLNILKDVPVDILKLDMRFFSRSGDMKRGGIILNAVMRMARWLDMPVIAEGVEEIEQADFLASIGCQIIQGYLYARPMPSAAFEELLSGERTKIVAEFTDDEMQYQNIMEMWNLHSSDSYFFNSYMGSAAVYEYYNKDIEILRVNKSFMDELQIENDTQLPKHGLFRIHTDDEPFLLIAAEAAIESGNVEEIEVRHTDENDNVINRILIKNKLLAKSNDRYLIWCGIERIN